MGTHGIEDMSNDLEPILPATGSKSTYAGPVTNDSKASESRKPNPFLSGEGSKETIAEIYGEETTIAAGAPPRIRRVRPRWFGIRARYSMTLLVLLETLFVTTSMALYLWASVETY